MKSQGRAVQKADRKEEDGERRPGRGGVMRGIRKQDNAPHQPRLTVGAAGN